MLGESYGGTRAAAVLRADKVRIDGVLMFAGAVRPIGPQGDDLAYMMRLPSMATTAAFHGRSELAGRSVGEIFDHAYDYATTDYALALIEGSEISAADAQRVAERLSALIGLPPEEILAQNLRVGVEHYVRNLLKDNNLRIGRLDTRVTGALDAPAQAPPWDDPSMVRSEANGGATYDDYFRDEIGFVSDRPYNSLNLGVNAAWDYGSGRAGAPNYATFIAAAMEANPALRLYSGAGYYDLGVPVAQMRYNLNHAGVPMDRVSFANYPTGHSLFEGDANLARLTDDVRAFVRGEAVSSSGAP
ncbi:MAG: hypothetical protein PVI23_11650, partial [Maricaulaceae bacterium]|jgi:carboxypeptidase C (cathepsin A)